MSVCVVPHRSSWFDTYDKECICIKQGLGEALIELHHIGSTSIPGVHAKPIIDILAVVSDVEVLDLRKNNMTNCGYQVMGEYGIDGRRYYRKDDNVSGKRLFHIHAFKTDSENIRRHLAFRNYLRQNIDEAQQYSNLKRELATRFPDCIESYMDGKDSFIKSILQKSTNSGNVI